MTLTDLITRLESGEGPDRELDTEIWEAIGISQGQEAYCKQWCRRDGRTDLTRKDFLLAWAPEFTGILDIALAQLPDGWGWEQICFSVPDSDTPDQVMACAGNYGSGKEYRSVEGLARTAHNAVLAAALRARAGGKETR